jgi:hypothetical protein
MRTLSASELLGVFERGLGEPSYRRAILLLSAACPEQSPDALEELSIGRRDGLLLSVRERTFGPRLTGVVECPACKERLDIVVSMDDIRSTLPEPSRSEFTLELDEYRVVCRLPCTRDLGEAENSGNGEAIRQTLIGRCILDARRGDEYAATEQLPARVIEAIVARMAEMDPQADSRLALTCPGCGHRWQALFDIVSFFWCELQHWTSRIMREVHVLASRYGWREVDILAMSPFRRRQYLNMVEA